MSGATRQCQDKVSVHMAVRENQTSGYNCLCFQNIRIQNLGRQDQKNMTCKRFKKKIEVYLRTLVCEGRNEQACYSFEVWV